MHTIKCKFGVPTISLIALAVFVANSLGDAQKIDAKIDLVVIWPTFDDDNVLDSTKRELAKLPELFLISDAKVKIAFVESNTNNVSQAVVFQLSGNETGFNNWINNWKPVSSTKVHVHTAFEAARTRVLQNGGERARVVVVMLRGWTIAIGESIKEAEKLRDAGVFIYVISQSDGSSCNKTFSNWTGGSSRCIDVDAIEFNTGIARSFKKLKNVILSDLCWKTACRYDRPNGKDCIIDVLPSTAIFDDHNRQCRSSIVKPTSPTIECCRDHVCDDECDRRWPWNVWPPNCDNASCGFKFYRTGDAPTKMENCLAEIQCPVCSPVSTSKTTAKESGMKAWEIVVICLAVGVVVVAVVIAVWKTESGKTICLLICCGPCLLSLLWVMSTIGCGGPNKKRRKSTRVVGDLMKELSEKSTESLSDLLKLNVGPTKIRPSPPPPSIPSKIQPPIEQANVAANICDDQPSTTSTPQNKMASVHKSIKSETKTASVKKDVLQK